LDDVIPVGPSEEEQEKLRVKDRRRLLATSAQMQKLYHGQALELLSVKKKESLLEEKVPE
jgi:hypothetical protein